MNRPGGWDGLRVLLALLLLTHVWRLQDLVPAVNFLKPQLLVTAAALALTLLGPDVAARAGRRFRAPVVRWALVLLGLGALSVPGSLYAGLSFDFLLKNQLDAVLLLVLLVLGIRNAGDVERLAAVQVAGAFCYTATMLLTVDVGPDGRLGDLTYYDANDLGMLLAGTLPLAGHFVWRGRSPGVRVAAAAATGLFLLGIVRTGSRGAFLGLVAVACFTLWRARHLPLRWRVASFATAGLLLIALGSTRYWSTVGSLLHPSQDYNWVGREPGGRMEVWRRGIGYMAARPVFGVGVGAFPVAEGTISPIAARQSYGGGAKWSAAHSSFVQVGAELGVGGLLAFLALLWSGYRAVLRGPAASGALRHSIAAALLGFTVTGAFLSQAYAPFLYSLLALAVGPASGTETPLGPRRLYPQRVRPIAAGAPS